MSRVKIVLGGANMRLGRAFPTPDLVRPVLDIVSAAGIQNIDTAQIYGNSEDLLGQVNAGERFVFDTKAPGGFIPGTLRSENLIAGVKESLKKLKVDKLDVFYIHAPDASAPLDDWLPGVNEVYQSGAFSRFGLSNFKADDVQRVYNYCKEKGYVLPSVYQGNYNAVARLQETILFPTLRQLGIAFYAYSPTAGGFLVKTKQSLLQGQGRFDPSKPLGEMYLSMYGRPLYLEALDMWSALAADGAYDRGEVALRWVAYDSGLRAELGDAILLSASSSAQMEQNLAWLAKGPLDAKTCKAVDEVWRTIEHDAPLDNYHR